MSEPIVFKYCPACKTTKPTSTFSKNAARYDGLGVYCKPCRAVVEKPYRQQPKAKAVLNAAYSRYRRSAKGKERNQRQYNKARSKRPAYDAVRYAVQTGKLAPVNTCECIECHGQADTYHHPNGYEGKYRLDVIPVCRPCHAILHGLT